MLQSMILNLTVALSIFIFIFRLRKLACSRENILQKSQCYSIKKPVCDGEPSNVKWVLTRLKTENYFENDATEKLLRDEK